MVRSAGLGGVCGGIAAKLNVDVAFVRIAFLLLACFPGPAFVFYLAAWLILPDQRNAIVLESFLDEALAPALTRPLRPASRPQPPPGPPAPRRVPLPNRRGHFAAVTVCVLPHIRH